jgi:hypothetical protein
MIKPAAAATLAASFLWSAGAAFSAHVVPAAIWLFAARVVAGLAAMSLMVGRGEGGAAGRWGRGVTTPACPRDRRPAPFPAVVLG